MGDYYHIVMAFYDVGVFFVWAVFAHLFYLKVRRQRHPRLIIHAEKYSDAKMQIAFNNMSSEPIYIRDVFLSIESDKGKEVFNLDNLHDRILYKKDAVGVDKQECQGVILPGDFVNIELRNVFSNNYKASRESGIDILPGDLVNVFAVFVYVAEDAFLGASRCFEFSETKGGFSFEALSWDTITWTSRQERRELYKLLKMEQNDRYAKVHSGG